MLQYLETAAVLIVATIWGGFWLAMAIASWLLPFAFIWWLFS